MATVDKPAKHGTRAIGWQPGEGETIRALVGALTFKVRGKQTNGALTVWESTPPPGEGPPLHVHANEDEALYTLDGTLRFRMGDEVQTAPAGAFAFIPRGTPHTWQNIGDAPARLLVIFTPAAEGVERSFERFAELPEDEMGLEAFRRLASKADMDVVGPPLADSHPLPQRAGAPEGPHADRISSEDAGASWPTSSRSSGSRRRSAAATSRARGHFASP